MSIWFVPFLNLFFLSDSFQFSNFLKKGNFREGLKLAKNYLKSNPKDVDAYENVAKAFSIEGKVIQAKEIIGILRYKII